MTVTDSPDKVEDEVESLDKHSGHQVDRNVHGMEVDQEEKDE